MDNFSDQIWVAKYSPESIEHMILPKGISRSFEKIISSGEIPNMIFYSNRPGTGKTSSAKALLNDIGIDYYYINVSLDRTIDVLRDDIMRYATTLSLNGGLKVVLMDEFDGARSEMVDALRAAIEGFYDSCRFIFTCNNISKIHEAIISRCELINFDFMTEAEKLKPQVCDRISGILEMEKVKFDFASIKRLVDLRYPDIRSIVKTCQQYERQNGGVIDMGVTNFSPISEDLYKFILEKNPIKARQIVMNNNYDYDGLYRAMFNNLVPMVEGINRSKVIHTLAHYMHESPKSLDKEITFTACILDIMEII